MTKKSAFLAGKAFCVGNFEFQIEDTAQKEDYYYPYLNYFKFVIVEC